MTRFSVSLAGVVLNVSTLYPSTKAFCREFLTKKAADCTLSLRDEDIGYERSVSEGAFSSAYLETLALLRKVSNTLIRYDTLLFHGSAIAYGGKAYVFTAPSGTGKTTHTRLWLKALPESYVLNGDKPFLRIEENRVLACGSPWRGKENYGVNEMLPLEAICILEQDSSNHIEQVPCSSALGALIRQTYRPADPSLLVRSIQLIGNVAQNIRLYHLGCNMDPEAALVSSKAMIR